MVKFLKKAIQTAKTASRAVRNPRRVAQRLAGKADRALGRTAVGKTVGKTVRKVDKAGMKLAKKAGVGKQYKAGRATVLKKAGIKKIVEGKKGLVSYAMRRGEREFGNLEGTKYKKKEKQAKPVNKGMNKISNPVKGRRFGVKPIRG